MIGYVITALCLCILVSIITEQMVIKRLQMTEGVEISRGRCRLISGYGKLEKVKE
jgi:hypothetical protein